MRSAHGVRQAGLIGTSSASIEHRPQQQAESRCTNITQLPPEILARIFHYVYISPVVIFPFQSGAEETVAASEGDPDDGPGVLGGQESMAVTRTFQCGGSVVCTIEEEHSVIEDDDDDDEGDIPAGGNAPCSFLPQIEGEARGEREGEGKGKGKGEGEDKGALWNDQDCTSRMSSGGSNSGSSSSSGGSSSSSRSSIVSSSRNSTSSWDDITEGSVDGACLAIGATARVIEGTTNRRTPTLISTPSEHVLQPNNTSDNNTIDNNSDNHNNSVHLTHFEEGYIMDHGNNSSSNGHHTSVTSDRHHNHQQQQQEIYIENDLFTLFHLCLTCRAFYDQAIRLLWRQRTLSTAHELKGFYHTMTQSLALATRPKDSLNQPRQREIEAALRIKSLTLLDMGLFDVGESSTTSPSFVRHSLADHHDLASGRTNGGGGGHSAHRHLRHRSNSNHFSQHFDPYHLPSDLDGNNISNNLVRWDQDTAAAAASGSKNASPPSSTSAGLSSPGRERASWAPGFSSSYGYDNAFWPSFSSSSSTSTSQWAAAAAVAAGSSSHRTHIRQKTSSIYSDIISPRLLHMVAEYCHALTDLTICIQTSELSLSASPTPGDHSPTTSTTSTASARRQPTITFSFLAGALPSLKRLTLAGVVCDPDQNKTGSELLAFARTIQPLETLNIRSCQGISDETLLVLAERSGTTLKRLDFQGMDFQQTEQLTKVLKGFVAQCPNLASLTLSCMASLDLDESLQAFVDCDSRLKELQILGHDHMVAQQPQPQQQQGMDGEAGAANEQQQQAQDGMQSVTTMCHLSDHVLLGLARLPRLARLTLYCTGMTDLAMIRFLSRAPRLEDLVLHEPTPVMHLPQLHSLTHYLFSHALSGSTSTTPLASMTAAGAEVTPPTPASDVAAPPPGQQPTDQPNNAVIPFEYTSASFLYLILSRRFRRCLSSLFIKISIETAQDWISQPVFQAAGLASCLYQYQNAHSGEPAVVLIWKP
ncbi:hypothetical protein DFQ26_005043 [Actinomortierella ambigua]|nr:hypothetical protein DFQ26_005043 [Actinomortierella ambigua]